MFAVPFIFFSCCLFFFFFFQAEDCIRELVRSRGLGDVYKRQTHQLGEPLAYDQSQAGSAITAGHGCIGLTEEMKEAMHLVLGDADACIFHGKMDLLVSCLLYTYDAADDLPCVDLGGRRIIKKNQRSTHRNYNYKFNNT